MISSNKAINIIESRLWGGVEGRGECIICICGIVRVSRCAERGGGG